MNKAFDSREWLAKAHLFQQLQTGDQTMSNDNNSTEDNKPNLPSHSHIADSVEKGSDDKGHGQKVGAAGQANKAGLALQLHAMPLRSKELERMREERKQTQGQDQTQDMNPLR